MFDSMFPSHWTTLRKLMWLKLKGTSAVWSTITGNPVSFSAKAAPLRQLKVAFSPVQDLHGYDSPWPAGGGKNKLHPVVRSVTSKGVTYTANEDGSITLNGTATGNESFSVEYVDSIITAPFGILATGGTHGATFTYGTTSTTYIYTDGGSVVVDTDTNKKVFTLNVLSGNTFNNVTIKIQIETGSAVPTAWTPFSNLCPISGWSSLTVEQRGANMWDEEWEVGAIVSGNPVPYASSIRSKNFSPCKPNASLYVKTPNNIIVWWYDRNKAWTGAYISAGNYVITVPADAYYFKIGAPQAYGTTYNHDISINYPSTDTSYHAYNPSSRSISISLGQTVYSGWVDVISGVLTVDWVGDVLDGTQTITVANWRPFDGTSAWLYGPDDFVGIIKNMLAGNVLSDKVKPSKYDDIYSGTVGASNMSFGNYSMAIRIPVDGLNNQTLINAYLAENPIQVCYKLAEPIPIQLTPQEVQSLLGENVLFSDANGDLTVEYRSN